MEWDAPSGAGNLIAVRINPGTTASPAPTAAVMWCSGNGGSSPMVTTTDGTSNIVVWNASSSLYGYDGDTGAAVFTGAMGGAIQPFNTPIDVGQGRIAVATTGGSVYVFTP